MIYFDHCILQCFVVITTPSYLMWYINFLITLHFKFIIHHADKNIHCLQIYILCTLPPTLWLWNVTQVTDFISWKPHVNLLVYKKVCNCVVYAWWFFTATGTSVDCVVLHTMCFCCHLLCFVDIYIVPKCSGCSEMSLKNLYTLKTACLFSRLMSHFPSLSHFSGIVTTRMFQMDLPYHHTEFNNLTWETNFKKKYIMKNE
jgi:hypothetical protein